MKDKLKIFGVILIVVLGSCSKKESTPEEKLQHLVHLISYADEIKFSDNSLISGSELVRPFGTWLELLRFSLKPSPDKEKLFYCLFYRTPFSQTDFDSQIRLYEAIDTNTKCQNVNLKDRSEIILEIDVSKTKLNLKNDYLDFYTELIQYKNFRIFQNKINFLNLKNKTKKSNITFYPIPELIDVLQISKKNPVSRRPLVDGDFCHVVDDKCNDVTPYICDRCPGPWYEVVAQGCSKSNNKICGANICGEKGQAACVSGKKNRIKLTADAICRTGSPFGFCSRGLHPFCENQKLICL